MTVNMMVDMTLNMTVKTLISCGFRGYAVRLDALPALPASPFALDALQSLQKRRVGRLLRSLDQPLF